MKFKVSLPDDTIQTVTDINWFINVCDEDGYHVSISHVSLETDTVWLYLVKNDSI